MSQLQEIALMTGGLVVFTCPNYGVVRTKQNTEIALDGPAIRGWQKANEKKIAELRDAE
jgi:hypothetical protein